MPDSLLRDKGGLLSPVIRKTTHRGRTAVVKDYRDKSFLARSILGPSLVRREFRILRHLDGLSGIPRAYAVLGGAALVTEFVDGRTIGKFAPDELPPGAFDALRDLVRAMHERGVVHLDLRQKKNILITSDHRPYLIDFGTALLLRRSTPWRRLLPGLRGVDETALLKVKQRSFPSLLTEDDRKQLRRHRFWRRFWIFTPRGKYVR